MPNNVYFLFQWAALQIGYGADGAMMISAAPNVVVGILAWVLVIGVVAINCMSAQERTECENLCNLAV